VLLLALFIIAGYLGAIAWFALPLAVTENLALRRIGNAKRMCSCSVPVDDDDG
jgi:hypothetical protein